MNEPFQGHGRWCLPNLTSVKDVVFQGKLTWTPEEGAMLEASGLDMEMWQAISGNQHLHHLIQGQLDSMPCITLDSALATSVSFPTTGDARVVFKSSRMAKGNKTVESFEKVLFTTLSCELTGLTDWAGLSSLKIEHQNKKTVIECMPYEAKQFVEIGGINVLIARWNRTSRGTRNFSAESVCSLELRGSVPFTYEQGREIMNNFKAFLTFALDYPVLYTSIRGSIPSTEKPMPDGKPRTDSVEFYERTDLFVSRKNGDFRSESIVLPFVPEERSAKAFSTFCEIYSSHRMAINFFLSETYASKSFINQTFADMVHGLEGLHRGLRGGNFTDQEKYDQEILPQLLAAIPSGIDKDLRVALKKRLEFGNEFSLRRRLKDIARFHKDHAESLIGKPCDFADVVAEMRNSLAHATGAKAPNRTTATKYFVMLHRVRILFQLELLHQLGLDSHYLKECIPRLKSAEFSARTC